MKQTDQKQMSQKQPGPKSSTASPRTRWWRSLVIRITLFVVLVLGVGLGGFVAWLSTSLPRQEGEIVVPFLDQSVTVIRDSYGIPTIKAESEAGAHFGLGFVHAQDRLFQMDIMRRTGSGRLAEIFGPDALERDRLARLIGFDRLAAASLNFMAPETIAALEAYTQGVNAFLATRQGALPLEFVLLGYEPEPWKPSDSLILPRLMAMWLSNNRREELIKARLSKIMSPQEVDLILGPYPDDQIEGVTGRAERHSTRPGNGLTPYGAMPRIGDDSSENDAKSEDDINSAHEQSARPLSRPLGDIDQTAQRLINKLWDHLPVAERRYGPTASNSWVVAGWRTKSGLPLLANDPHLWLSTPGVWYLSRLQAPGYDVAGGTMPGVPFVVAGHNQDIAWGYTTTHSDTQDYFIERLVLDDEGRYLTPDGSQAFIERVETIQVKGESPVTLVARASRHGPIMSDLALDNAVLEEGHVLALADTALRDDVLLAQAIYRLNKAADWSDFVEAMADFHAPHQNVIYADRAGHIGFYAAGRVPVRKSGDGSAPVPGWSGDYDWVSLIPFEELPHLFDPPEGVIATANHKIITEDYPHLLTSRWRGLYRADYIHQRLAAGDGASIEGMIALQNNVVSPMAVDLLPLMLTVMGDQADQSIQAALQELQAWDGSMDRQSSAPLIFKTWLRFFQQQLMQEPLGDLFAVFSRPQPVLIKAALEGKTRFCRLEKPAPIEESAQGLEKPDSPLCQMLLTASLNAALEALADAYGDDPAAWRWGNTHQASFLNRLTEHIPFLGVLKGAVIETDGGDYTINQGGTAIGAQFSLKAGLTQFQHLYGAGMKAIYDLGDPWSSLFIAVPGQSGNIFSPHSHDMVRLWRDGDYLMVSDHEQDNPKAKILTLLPQSSSATTAD